MEYVRKVDQSNFERKVVFNITDGEWLLGRDIDTNSDKLFFKLTSFNKTKKYNLDETDIKNDLDNFLKEMAYEKIKEKNKI